MSGRRDLALETHDLGFVLILTDLVLTLEVMKLGDYGIELGGLFSNLATPFGLDALVRSVLVKQAVLFGLQHFEQFSKARLVRWSVHFGADRGGQNRSRSKMYITRGRARASAEAE